MRQFFSALSKHIKPVLCAFATIVIASPTLSADAHTNNLPNLTPTLNERSISNDDYILGHYWFRKLAGGDGSIFFPPLNDYLRIQLAELAPYTQLSNKQIEFALLNSQQTNAFVIPGNHLFIYSEMATIIEDEDGLLALLAHEIAHLELNHYQRGQAQQHAEQKKALAIMLAGVVAATQGAGEIGSSMMIGGMANQAENILTYSREHEREADRRGKQLLVAAGKATGGMERLLAALANQAQLNPDLAFLYTHPLPTQRVADQVTGTPATTATTNRSFDYFRATLLTYRAFADNDPEQFLKSNVPTHTLPYANALRLYLSGQSTQAKHLLNQLKDNNDFTEYLSCLIWMNSGELTLALDRINSRLKLDPDNLNYQALKKRIVTSLPYLAFDGLQYYYQTKQYIDSNLNIAETQRDDSQLYSLNAMLSYSRGNTGLALKFINDGLQVNEHDSRLAKLKREYEEMRRRELEIKLTQ